jgi:transketolase
MFLSGYPLMIEDIKNYRKINSKLPATPDISTFGIDISTGFRGEGIASATGIALAEKIYEEKYNYKVKGFFDKTKLPKLFDYYTYVLIDDEEIMEGLNYEAASFAGNYGLGKLIVLWDTSGITKDGPISKSFYDDTLSRFSALGWSTKTVKNGNSVTEIASAIRKAKQGSQNSMQGNQKVECYYLTDVTFYKAFKLLNVTTNYDIEVVEFVKNASTVE